MVSSNNFIKKNYSELTLLSILFLFFIQLTTDLVEAIYMMDLLNTSLDEKVLGVLFFLSAFVILFFRKGFPEHFLEIIAGILIVSRIINPFLDTASRIISAGIGVSCFMIFLPSFLLKKQADDGEKTSYTLGVGLAFAVVLSIMFRTLGSTLDVSTYKGFQVIGWVLAAIAILMIAGQIKIEQEKGDNPTSTGEQAEGGEEDSKGIYSLVLGLISIITIIYFAFSSPTVISRWTEGDYIAIVITTSVMIALYAIVATIKPELLEKLTPRMIKLWNGLFALSVILTIAVHTVSFPSTATSAPVIVIHPPAWYYHIPLVAMLVLLPILFVDFSIFSREIIKRKPSPSKMSLSFVIGSLFLVLMVFMLIFTNVWGYIDEVSLVLRNLFWLPFLFVGIAFTGPILRLKKEHLNLAKLFKDVKRKKLIAGIVAIMVCGTVIGVFITSANPQPVTGDKVNTLKIFTYNIQQGVNVTGDKNYDNQIALIKEINPDIIGLQECDSARISLGNSDVVRYFADRLSGMNYYSFFGPKTVTGTFGAAILSKYPIISAKTFFTYSDVDEIGTTEVQIQIGDEIFNVFISHPAGGHEAKLAHVEALMFRIHGRSNVISMGDFNFREDTEYYERTVFILKDTWRARWPTGIDDNNLNMKRRIDHIFVSRTFVVLETRFITDPQSDHPALWTEIKW